MKYLTCSKLNGIVVTLVATNFIAMLCNKFPLKPETSDHFFVYVISN